MIFVGKKSGRVHKALYGVSYMPSDVRRLVARLIPGKKKIKTAKLYRRGDTYYLESEFDTKYSGGTLENFGRLIFKKDRTYGVIGVSPKRATSKRLMSQGLKLFTWP